MLDGSASLDPLHSLDVFHPGMQGDSGFLPRRFQDEGQSTPAPGGGQAAESSMSISRVTVAQLRTVPAAWPLERASCGAAGPAGSAVTESQSRCDGRTMTTGQGACCATWA